MGGQAGRGPSGAHGAAGQARDGPSWPGAGYRLGAGRSGAGAQSDRLENGSHLA